MRDSNPGLALALKGLRVAVVNLGARLRQPFERLSDRDYAWDLVEYALPTPPGRWRVAAFEADADNCKHIVHEKKLARAGRFANASVSLRCGFVRGHTVASEFALLGIPRKFALLKVDIDSSDLAVAAAALASYEPALLLVEFNQHTPLPIEFAALEPNGADVEADLHPTYHRGRCAPPAQARGERDAVAGTAASVACRSSSCAHAGGGPCVGEYRGFNSVWPCFGASLASWAAFATRRGYALVTTDGGNNALFMRRAHYTRAVAHAPHRFNTSTDEWCHAHATHSQVISRLDGAMRSRLPGRAPNRSVATHSAMRRASPSHGVAVPWRPPLGPDADPFDYSAALRTIARRCGQNLTPFLARVHGVCCRGLETTRLCRCSA